MNDHPEVVSALEEASVEDGLRLWWFGGPSYALKGAGGIVYVDPFYSGPRADDPRGFIRDIDNFLLPETVHHAELVLSTHDHSDHCDPASLIPMAAQTDALFAVAASSAVVMRAWPFDEGRMRVMAPGDVLERGAFTLHACPSHDWSDPHAVTFVLQAAGRSVFIGGDTMSLPEMEEIGRRFQIDLAVLALARNRLDIIDQPLYFTPQELAEAARALRARRVLPIHWDIWRAWKEDPNLVAQYLEGSETELVLLAQGASLEV